MLRTGSPCAPITALLALAIGAGPLLAEPLTAAPDWGDVVEIDTVQVRTIDQDGDERTTTVWLVVVDGEAYLRTGDTRWGANLERDPVLTLRIGDDDYDLRVEMVEDEALRTRVVEAFREKYGWSDAMISVFRSGRPRIMRLLPR